MYAANHLAHRLSAGSVGRETTIFAEVPGREPIAFEALFAAAERIAASLLAEGLHPGDRVAAQVEKSPEAIALYLATVLAGGVFLPLNPAYTESEIAYFLDNAEPRIFVCDPARAKALGPAAANVAIVRTLAGDGSGNLLNTSVANGPRLNAAERGGDDVAAILYTSGTTGRPKGAMVTHANLASNAVALATLWRFTADDRLIHALPIFHTHGLFVATNVALVSGCSLLFQARFDVEAVLDCLPNATAMMGVPTFYTRLLGQSRLTRALTAHMRLFISGSAPLPAEVHEAWRDRTGHAILERYGMTETNMITSNPYDGTRRPGTVGLPLPGVALRVADPATGDTLPQGEIGSIELRGPNVFAGYWRQPDKTAEEFRSDGYFVTGDLGRIDAEGYLAIVGRSKDLIISGGYNIYPKEIEALIDEVTGVAESAVIGLPHPDLGEGVAAVVVPTAGCGPTSEAVEAALAPGLARYKQPKAIFFVDDLPRNAMGKVQKAVLRERFSDAFSRKGR